ncbi:YraN family protein [Candidatus Peregrinibacteria bacterium]|nr:YraN family protein [Candidatus Peregrinibacteria bacterium]
MLGKKGERLAAHFLQSQGYGILESNVRFQHKELDLIAEKNGELIFIEVKTRRGTNFGHGEEAVSHKKQKNVLSVGFEYVKKHPALKFLKWRFDIIAIDIAADGSAREVEHIKDVY